MHQSIVIPDPPPPPLGKRRGQVRGLTPGATVKVSPQVGANAGLFSRQLQPGILPWQMRGFRRSKAEAISGDWPGKHLRMPHRWGLVTGDLPQFCPRSPGRKQLLADFKPRYFTSVGGGGDYNWLVHNKHTQNRIFNNCHYLWNFVSSFFN